MRIEKNTSGYGPARPGIGYLIFDAPAVADIPAGSVWLLTCDLQVDGGEDTLQLLDLGDIDMAEEVIDQFVISRNVCVSQDWSGALGLAPKSLFSRAGFMFKVVADVMPELFSDRDYSTQDCWWLIERSGADPLPAWGSFAEAAKLAEAMNAAEGRDPDTDGYTAGLMEFDDFERHGPLLDGMGVNADDAIRNL